MLANSSPVLKILTECVLCCVKGGWEVKGGLKQGREKEGAQREEEERDGNGEREVGYIEGKSGMCL